MRRREWSMGGESLRFVDMGELLGIAGSLRVLVRWCAKFSRQSRFDGIYGECHTRVRVDGWKYHHNLAFNDADNITGTSCNVDSN